MKKKYSYYGKFTDASLRKRVFGYKSAHPSIMQPFYAQANKLVPSYVQICFRASYLNLHAQYSHMPYMLRGRTCPGLPCP